MQKKNYDAVDLFKWICSFLIMYIHFAPVFPDLPGLDRVISQGLCRIAVPFFFAASAFLLFRKMGDPKTDRSENQKKLLRFCGHILLMYTVWIAIYSAYYVFYNAYNGLPQRSVKEYLLGFFFAGRLQLQLWYLIATVYATPVVYLLWRGGRKLLFAGIIICEVLCCLEWPYRFLPFFKSSAWVDVLNAYTLPINALLNGVPMMCIGALCVTDHKQFGSKKWFCALLLAAMLYAMEVAGLYAYYGRQLAAGGMITRGFFTYCLVNWLFTVNFSLPIKGLGKVLRLSSTWNYCAHIMVWMLSHWVFNYEGVKHYVVVGGLTVISGVPYIAIKLLLERMKNNSKRCIEMRG